MKDYSEQVYVALNAYLERGRQVLAAADAHDIVGVDHWLLAREHAFHNFRVAEVLAHQKGYNLLKDPRVRDLWLNIQDINAALDVSLTKLQQDTREEISKTQETRKKFAKYRSGKLKAAEFVQAV